MDFLKSILGNNTADLVSSLTQKANFSPAQAQAFVPEAANSVVEVVKDAGSDIDFSNVGAAAQTVIGKVDVASLAGKVGISTDQVQSGLGAIVPQLMQLFQQKAGGAAGLMKLMGGLGEGGLGNMIGGLGKKFGK